MKTISGAYASAIIYDTQNEQTGVEPYALAQLKALCGNPAAANAKIRVMPDVHPGKVCTIGLSMRLGTDRILPELIGCDIGCGILMAKLRYSGAAEWQKLDKVIREQVPNGFALHKTACRTAEAFDFSRLSCAAHIDQKRALLSLGTLGGGNHFIEADRDENGGLYLLLHTGSRRLGKEVTDFYLAEGQKALRKKQISVPYELTYLEGELMQDYLHDLAVVQDFAAENRAAILSAILRGMKWKAESLTSCIHNYIDFTARTAPVLRKGAISAKCGEPVVIPINMRDGVILGTGLGNTDWNESAPHGAGRIYKREEVKQHFTVSAFKKEMRGIYSSSVSAATLDEAPFAYRSIGEIEAVIGDTVKIEKVLHPVYNFKAGK